MSIILENIFSTEFVYMWIRVVTPILLPALGGAICNRAGVVNLGLEGIMLISALAGVLGGAYGGSLLTGLLAGLGAALLVSLVFAYFHLNLRADATICGTAVNTFASGFTVLLLFTLTGQKGTSGSLKSFSFPTVHIPVIEDIPVVGSILSGHNLMTYVALLAVLVVWFLLYKTPLGLRIRSVGENPDAASSVKYMRQACKNVMYTVVNSWVYEEEGVDTGMPPWEKAVIVADAAVGVILLGLCALIYRKYKKDSASGR